MFLCGHQKRQKSRPTCEFSGFRISFFVLPARKVSPLYFITVSKYWDRLPVFFLTLSATKVGRFLLLAHREPSKQWVCHHPVNTPFPLGELRLCWHPHGGCVLFSPLSPSQTLQLPTTIYIPYFQISFLAIHPHN